MRLAYSPLLALKESHVAAYKIYKLLNPDTLEIFYVGQTVMDLETRLSGHLSQMESNKPKVEYIQKLLADGKKPLIVELESIHATCYIDKHFVNERERYWIKHYKSIGCNLLNISVSAHNSRSEEYHSYLASIRKNETSWHYYYCGQTYGGAEVYDVKKLEADGFKFTQEEEKEKSESYNKRWWYPSDGNYDPWKNPRFIKSIGYKIDPSNHLSYVPCYNDTNPNYYNDDTE